MKISIEYNKKYIKDYLPFLSDNIKFFKDNKMFYYFPFDKNRLADDGYVENQILLDEAKFGIDKKIKEFKHNFSIIEKDLLNCLRVINKDFKKIKSIKCYLTMYGCYGYYDRPNRVIVNIVNREVLFNLETMTHEIIHLLIENENLSHEKEENLVDSVFDDIRLKKIFSNYHKQELL